MPDKKMVKIYYSPDNTNVLDINGQIFGGVEDVDGVEWQIPQEDIMKAMGFECYEDNMHQEIWVHKTIEPDWPDK